jgi:hypothetical protein
MLNLLHCRHVNLAVVVEAPAHLGPAGFRLFGRWPFDRLRVNA